MIIKVDGKHVRIAFSKGTVSTILSRLRIPREEVLVKVNGKLAPEDAELLPKDKVEIIKVVFGG